MQSVKISNAAGKFDGRFFSDRQENLARDFVKCAEAADIEMFGNKRVSMKKAMKTSGKVIVEVDPHFFAQQKWKFYVVICLQKRISGKQKLM